jgi:hypothetical protein
MTPSVQRCTAIVVIGCLWLAGCAKLAYQHMNDPSRDAWQKPKEAIEKLAIARGHVSQTSVRAEDTSRGIWRRPSVQKERYTRSTSTRQA